MRQQTGKVTAQLKLKTLNDNPYLMPLVLAKNRLSPSFLCVRLIKIAFLYHIPVVLVKVTLLLRQSLPKATWQ